MSDYTKIAEKVREFFQNECINLTTIQPEFTGAKFCVAL